MNYTMRGPNSRINRLPAPVAAKPICVQCQGPMPQAHKGYTIRTCAPCGRWVGYAHLAG